MKDNFNSLSREMGAFEAALRERGLSPTYQRRAIAEAAFSTHAHFSADELLQLARRREPRVGRVTVYRTLEVLTEAGLVEERRFRKDRALYEHVVGHGHHDHMVCVACGKILEFHSPRIEAEQAKAARRLGFQVLHHSHTLFGRCRSCAKGARGR
jgi:Fur family transcriptional regulator, ferric uptake regulator